MIASSPPPANSGDMHSEAAADVSLSSSLTRSSIFTPLSVLPGLSFESGCFGPSSPSSYSYSPLVSSGLFLLSFYRVSLSTVVPINHIEAAQCKQS